MFLTATPGKGGGLLLDCHSAKGFQAAGFPAPRKAFLRLEKAQCQRRASLSTEPPHSTEDQAEALVRCRLRPPEGQGIQDPRLPMIVLRDKLEADNAFSRTQRFT